MTHRLTATFAALREANRPAFVTYIMAGDTGLDTSLAIMHGLPEAGADIIELGMPFSDPMADGPAIQAAALRSLDGGHTMQRTFDMVRAFRDNDDATPIILMGYYNPIYRYGPERWLANAKAAGIDGMIIVDLPPEMDEELCLPALEAGLSFIRLATPTTDAKRLPKVLSNTSGFVYYVSMNGITGSADVDPEAVAASVAHIKAKTDLPICVGFGVKSAEHAGAIGKAADGVVVGSAIVSAIASAPEGNAVDAALAMVRDIAEGVRFARA